MLKKSRCFHLLLLGAAAVSPLLITGCGHRVYRVYDPYYTDYHAWGPDEDVYYHRWLGERHYNYQDFRRLPVERQHEYWSWRHEHHEDRDHH